MTSHNDPRYFGHKRKCIFLFTHVEAHVMASNSLAFVTKCNKHTVWTNRNVHARMNIQMNEK